MRRSARLAEKQDAKLANEAQREPNQKKSRLNNTTSKIATMDNGTMVEAFKYLDYCRLAQNSLISKRFRNVIQAHRHSLPRLYVASISMKRIDLSERHIKMFDEELSREEYHAWIVRNGYSKQIPHKGQIAMMQCTKKEYYEFSAKLWNIMGFYQSQEKCPLAIECAELNNEYWPLFQHFVRLLMDPFIYIRYLTLPSYHKYIFQLLAGAMDPDRDLLHCELLPIRFLRIRSLNDTQDFIAWIKDHVRCDELRIDMYSKSDSNFDEELLDLFLTGVTFTSEIKLEGCYDLSEVVVALVQKFMDLKNRDEYQVVVPIHGKVDYYIFVEELKRNFAEFIAEDEQDGDTKIHVFRFINNGIAKKLTISYRVDGSSSSSIKITDL